MNARNWLFLLVALLQVESLACTTFNLPGSREKIVGKSFDWTSVVGTAMANHAGVEKTGLKLWPSDKPPKWTSLYSSLTFNHNGREFPLSGINTAGLVVEIMWLDGTEPEGIDKRQSLNELQWIQYQLDNFKSVEEVLENIKKIRISQVYAQVHYLICDATGACTAVEHLKRAQKVTQAPELVVNVLTNDTYQKSLDRLKTHVGFGGELPIPTTTGSGSRFVRAAHESRLFDPNGPQSAVDYAFGMLDSVLVKGWTKWNVVYNPEALQVHFRTSIHPAIKLVNLSTFDTVCGKDIPVRTYDINQDHEGVIDAHFVPYSEEANQALVKQGFAGLPIPKFLTDKIANYPAKETHCVGLPTH